MSDGAKGRTREQLAAIEAVKDIRDVRDAYCAVQTLLDAPHALTIQRAQLVELVRLLNNQFDDKLLRAEAAVLAM